MLIDGNPIIIPLNKTVAFTITTVVRRVDIPGSSAGWSVLGVVENHNDSIAITGSLRKTELANDQPGLWGFDVDVSPTDPHLILLCQGRSGQTIRWVARIEFTEVAGGGYYS
jgi:hypothetical protein